MTTLIAIGAVQAGFLAVLVATKPGRAEGDRLLAWLLGLICGLFASVYWALAHDLPDLLLPAVNCGLLMAPVFYLYVSRSLSRDSAARPWDKAHFAAYAGSWIYLLGMILSGREAQLEVYFQQSDVLARSWAFNLMTLAELVSVPIYVLLSLRELAGHRRLVRQRLAYGEGVDYAWLDTLAKAVLGLWVVLTLPVLFNLHVGWADPESTITWSFVAATPLVFFLGFFGLRQTDVFAESGLGEGATASARGPIPPLAPQVETTLAPTASGVAEAPARVLSTEPQTDHDEKASSSAKYRKAGLDEGAADQLLVRLQTVMDEESPYLDNTLSLAQLAGLTGMSTHHLSQLINEHGATSFYEFVNGYRVEEFKRQVAAGNHRGRTLLALALDCGFNAKSSFNRIFKKATGMTPSAFVKAQAAGRSVTEADSTADYPTRSN